MLSVLVLNRKYFQELLSNGPLVVLPSATFPTDIISLFSSWVDLGGKPCCSGCGSTLQKKHCLTDNNVLVFFSAKVDQDTPSDSQSHHWFSCRVWNGAVPPILRYLWWSRGDPLLHILDAGTTNRQRCWRTCLHCRQPLHEDVWKGIHLGLQKAKKWRETPGNQTYCYGFSSPSSPRR